VRTASSLLLDLADCPYLDSGGLSVLLYAVREVQGTGWLGVVAPSRNLVRLFEISGLAVTPDFRLFVDLDEAPAALEAGRNA
jgi:anti-anti-sigma factor